LLCPRRAARGGKSFAPEACDSHDESLGNRRGFLFFCRIAFCHIAAQLARRSMLLHHTWCTIATDNFFRGTAWPMMPVLG
jgi:hypothetical protein